MIELPSHCGAIIASANTSSKAALFIVRLCYNKNEEICSCAHSIQVHHVDHASYSY